MARRSETTRFDANDAGVYGPKARPVGPDYALLFSRVNGLRAPDFDATEFDVTKRNDPGAVVLRETKRKSAAGTATFIDCGRRLAKVCGTLADETLALMGILDSDPWKYQRREVVGVLEQFFEAAGDRPALLWGFCLCWGDPAMALLRRRIDVEPTPVYRTWHERGARARLSFNASRKSSVTVAPSEIAWLVPDGLPLATCRVYKDVRIRRFCEAGRILTGSYRESLGLAADIEEHRAALAGGLYPALKGLAWEVLLEPDGQCLGVRPTDLGSPAQLPEEGTEQGPNVIGILDVILLMGWRLVERELGGVRESKVEKLSFTFDRSGLTAYIATDCERFDYLGGGRFEEDFLGEWLSRRA